MRLNHKYMWFTHIFDVQGIYTCDSHLPLGICDSHLPLGICDLHLPLGMWFKPSLGYMWFTPSLGHMWFTPSPGYVIHTFPGCMWFTPSLGYMWFTPALVYIRFTPSLGYMWLTPSLRFWDQSRAFSWQVRNRKLLFLFFDQNTCCGYTKESFQWDLSFEHPQHTFKLVGMKEITILRSKILFI